MTGSVEQTARGGLTIRDPAVSPSPADGGTAPHPRHRDGRSSGLRALLVGCDVAAAVLGWGLIGGVSIMVPAGLPSAPVLAVMAVAVAATMLGLVWQRLYRARVCVIRSVELQRLTRAVLAAAAVTAITAHFLGLDEQLLAIGAAALATLALLTAGRSIYRSWLRHHRRQGRFTRRVVLVGDDAEAVSLAMSLQEHPETGLTVCGVVSIDGECEVAAQLGVPWLGSVETTERALQEVGANGAVVVSSALPPRQVDALARQLPASGYHVHVTSDVRGIAPQRLWPMPLGYEPTLYVEPVPLRAWQARLKRGLDVVLASVTLVAAAPVLLVAAAAIKLEDGGPVLFRQPRVGLGNARFHILKLRSMEVDAESRAEDLAQHNERTEGPLFKLANDPRVTRCGRLLRRTSIDELPQLLNVLRGEMSLVGPRPALPDETAQFDAELQRRVAVRPGITGLWQTEARDNPAFGPYRRLDLYYVENWSVGLDLSILVTTLFVVLNRILLPLPLPGRAAPPSPRNATLD